MSVLVVLEHRDGQLARISREALHAGQMIAALQSKELTTGAFDASESYTPEGYINELQRFIADRRPSFIVFPHTYRTRDFAPRLAARLGRPLLADVIEIGLDGTSIFGVRQLYQGKLNGRFRFEGGGPHLLTVQAGAFDAADDSSLPAPELLSIEAGSSDTKPGPPFRETERDVDLSVAQSIVAVGRGIQDADRLAIMQELATVLGAQLAASRPVCDNGWLPLDRQVGSSGQTVSPRLYVAVGISGAIQHIVGMKGSRTIVAINKDPAAPIFEIADYGIVGDLFDIVPALTDAIRKLRR